MKSLMTLPNTHIDGDVPVSGSGVLRYCKSALWNASVFRSPASVVLFVRRRLIVFTPISALQLLWGNAVDNSLCFTHQLRRKVCVDDAVNSKPLSLDNSVGAPYVEKHFLKVAISPFAPS